MRPLKTLTSCVRRSLDSNPIVQNPRSNSLCLRWYLQIRPEVQMRVNVLKQGCRHPGFNLKQSVHEPIVALAWTGETFPM